MNKSKFSSRKFIISVATFLGSIGASIYGLHTDNNTIATIGIICAIISSALYSAIEGYIDATAVTKKTIQINDSRETDGK